MNTVAKITGEKTATVEAPSHIAIIMDGNGRWAAERGLPHIAGHHKGAEAVRRCIKACAAEGVRYLTLYAFSSENWSRPLDEVTALMSLLRLYIQKEIAELMREGVRVRFIGERKGLEKDIIRLIESAEEKTKTNKRLDLIIALNYGSRQEITRAARQLAGDVADGKLQASDINEQLFSSYLLMPDVPDPDLIIRTSGEQRLSNFLLWQAAYAELVFVDGYWPDFDAQKLKDAMKEFHTRERRYGARGQ